MADIMQRRPGKELLATGNKESNSREKIINVNGFIDGFPSNFPIMSIIIIKRIIKCPPKFFKPYGDTVTEPNIHSSTDILMVSIIHQPFNNIIDLYTFVSAFIIRNYHDRNNVMNLSKQ